MISTSSKSSEIYLEDLSSSHSIFLFPTSLHKNISASLCFVLCVAYTVSSIRVWENQVKESREVLKEIEQRISTIQYQKLRYHFQQGRKFQ